METLFGADFSDVRIHVGGEASAIGALAFTHGSDLYFAHGQYNPNLSHGQRLLGHELAHVVQQRAGRVRNPFGTELAVIQDPGLEAEAERMGLRALNSQTNPLRVGLKPPVPKAPRPVQPRTAQPAKPAPRPLPPTVSKPSSAKVVQRVQTLSAWLKTGGVKVEKADRGKTYWQNVLKPAWLRIRPSLSQESQKQMRDRMEEANLLAQSDPKLAVKKINAIADTITQYESLLSFQTFPAELMYYLMNFLSLRDQARFSSTSGHLRLTYESMPIHGVPIRNIHRAMEGYQMIGLHGSSSTFNKSLYEGLKVPIKEVQVSDFNQLGSGFYVAPATSEKNRDASAVFGKSAVLKHKGKLRMFRAFGKQFFELESAEVPEEDWIKEQRDLALKGSTITNYVDKYDYLTSDIDRFKGATQIKVNPRAFDRIKVLPPLDDEGNIDPEELVLWLNALFQSNKKKKKEL